MVTIAILDSHSIRISAAPRADRRRRGYRHGVSSGRIDDRGLRGYPVPRRLRKRLVDRHVRPVRDLPGGSGPDGLERLQHRAAGTPSAGGGPGELPQHRTLRGGHLRELGERVPSDGVLRPAHDLAGPEGFLGVEATRRQTREGCPPQIGVQSASPRSCAARRWQLTLYENSLGIALGLLFVLSFVLHALGALANTAQSKWLMGVKRSAPSS